MSSFVYFIAPADRTIVKIGFSHCPKRRLEELGAWSPVPLTILAYVPGSSQDELALHSRYAALHSHREWFRASEEMLADIAMIARLGELPAAFKAVAGQRNPLARIGIRSTPEWRAKVSAVQKARWAQVKYEKALVSAVQSLIAREKISVARFNKLLGFKAVHQRPDRSVFLSLPTVEKMEKLEAFLGFPQQQEAA